MTISVFADKSRPPSDQEILDALGARQGLWQNLVDFLEEQCRAARDLVFYGKNYGWAVRFRRGRQALASLYPAWERFTVQIVLPEPQAQEALLLPLGANAHQAIRGAKPYPEGRWLFIQVESELDFEDVHQVLMLKASLPVERQRRQNE